MKAVKGYFDDGTIRLAEVPRMSKPTEVLVIFPESGQIPASPLASATRRLYDLNMNADEKVVFSLDEDWGDIELVPEGLPDVPKIKRLRFREQQECT